MRRRRLIGVYRGLRKSMDAVAPIWCRDPRRRKASGATQTHRDAAYPPAPAGLSVVRTTTDIDPRRAHRNEDIRDIVEVALTPRSRYARRKAAGKSRRGHPQRPGA